MPCQGPGTDPSTRLQVVRAAEEAASTLASSIHPEQCIKVLCPIIQTADYPINLAAIKMQTKVVERIAKESLLQLLADIIPGLLQVSPAGRRALPLGQLCLLSTCLGLFCCCLSQCGPSAGGGSQ